MRIRVVDAFTDDETWMRLIAAEMKHAETAFAGPSDATDADWDLRWFTPAVGAQLCGHATLTTTHAMAADGLVDGKVRFSTRSGILTAEVAPDGAITLDFPAAPPIAAKPPAAEDPEAGYDFVSRFFAPAYGIPEDPVTGSAHTVLAPYWAARLGRDHLVGFQASARGGLVHVVPDGDRVRLTGRAVTVLDGTLADEVRPRSRRG